VSVAVVAAVEPSLKRLEHLFLVAGMVSGWPCKTLKVAKTRAVAAQARAEKGLDSHAMSFRSDLERKIGASDLTRTRPCGSMTDISQLHYNTFQTWIA